jgi:hypothetical protein
MPHPAVAACSDHRGLSHHSSVSCDCSPQRGVPPWRPPFPFRRWSKCGIRNRRRCVLQHRRQRARRVLGIRGTLLPRVPSSASSRSSASRAAIRPRHRGSARMCADSYAALGRKGAAPGPSCICQRQPLCVGRSSELYLLPIVGFLICVPNVVNAWRGVFAPDFCSYVVGG